MKVTEAIRARRSIRAYLPREVEIETVQRVLDTARHAPSGGNLQPWQVAVVSGAAKQRLQQRLEAACRGGEAPKMAYQYYPVEWHEPYKGRRLACGLQLFGALGIERSDKQGKLEQWAANFRAFDAPVMLFFFMDEQMAAGAYIDMGIFVQSVMLAAVEEGLATCPQAALAEFPDIVREELGYPEESLLIAGMALGYADEAAVVNQYRTERIVLDEFVRFIA